MKIDKTCHRFWFLFDQSNLSLMSNFLAFAVIVAIFYLKKQKQKKQKHKNKKQQKSKRKNA